MKQFLILIVIIAAIFLTSCMQEEIETSENRIAMHTLISIRAVGIDSKIAVDRSFERIHDKNFKLLDISRKVI